MGRFKEKKRLIHQATTLEYLHCLGNMQKWSQVLYDHKSAKSYNDFLKWILQRNYFKDEEKISIKKISELSNYPTTKINKWLREIYEDIFQLNDDNPELFYLKGHVQVELHFKYFDSTCSFKISLPVLPRQYETVDFFFIKAKIGFHIFWVKDIQHIIGENKMYIIIFLDGGFANIYREFALSKALFEGTLGIMDIYQKYDFEIDEVLRKRR